MWPLLLAVLLSFGGCRKDHELDCFKSNGKVTVERRELKPFTTLRVFDNIEVIVVQDSERYAEVRTGRNLQEDIVLDERDNTLRISNTSRCNWVRRYDVPRQVFLHTPNLKEVFHIGEKVVRSEGPFRQDTLFLHLSRAGDIEFDVESNYLWVDQYELGDMRLSGHTNELHATVGDLGSLYAKPLRARRGFVTLNFNGDGNAHVTATELISADIEGPGSLYYAGSPPERYFRITGKGRAVAE
ncbi:head GIN domain-containing protein [Hymenobacter koreensis]|uniref:Putative auto-transporter adhesin head GIN domain-containing protein n=1 Tax=Hymenobacter koreensis TaxID=1084523 RepID=A0ABP8IY77_9BACT